MRPREATGAERPQGNSDKPAEAIEGPLELEHFLPYRLSTASNAISKAFARRYEADFGLTIPEWRVMAVLGRFAPATSHEVCRRTGMDKAKVSRALARLVASGTVSRRDNPSDQRSNLLALSRKGRRTYEQIVPIARRLERDLREVMTPEEAALLDDLLARLQARGAALCPNADEAEGLD
jgi:DNA-binding MarR family transcriptional regulator